MSSKRNKAHLWLFFAGLCLVMVGFLLSRAVLSIGTIVLISNGLLQNDYKERWQKLTGNHFFLLICLLFIVPFISGLWSANTADWAARCIDKLPLLLLPPALIMQKGFEKKQYVFFSVLWILLMLAGTCWSMVQYLTQVQFYHQQYHFSKVIPTPASNDHIRFSIAIVTAILLWMKMEEWKAVSSKTINWFMRAIVCWFIIYLHILGSKTGLLGVYLIILPVFIWYLFKLKKATITVTIAAIALLLPFAAYKLLPTFKTRVWYVLYDKDNWMAGNFNGKFSDGNRILSMRAGADITQKNLLYGVGYGDIKDEVNQWFNIHAPVVALPDRYLPLNQWLAAGSGTGIAGILLFTLTVLLPLFLKQWRLNKPAFAFLVFMNLVFLYECTVEDQFGVFLFCFFVMWWYFSDIFKP